MLPEEDFTMWRDISPEELAKGQKRLSGWEVLFWMALIGAMFVAEIIIVGAK